MPPRSTDLPPSAAAAPRAVPEAVEQLIRTTGSLDAARALAPELGLTASGAMAQGAVARGAGRATGDPIAERAWLERDGIARLGSAESGAVCGRLVAAIDGLVARSLPPTFVYLFDEPWLLGDRIRAQVTEIVGHEYRLVEDVWAWRITPGEGRGWAPHRGIAHERLDRRAPEIVNVWIALSDVEADRACMHAIPLDDDPGYPAALGSVDAPLGAVRALPASAGDALVWNANVLHWGGRCATRAAGPRVSGSFTLCRADARERFPELVMLAPLDELRLTRRVDAIARMVLLYGERDGVNGVAREWATLVDALRALGERKAP